MKNAIIINGTVYELVTDIEEDVCDTCAIRFMCHDQHYALCVLIHDAEYNEHYVERPKQKGGDA